MEVILLEMKENEKEILEIAEKTRAELSAEYKINIPMPEVLPTIVGVYIEELIKHVVKNKTNDGIYEINFMQLFDIGVEGQDNSYDPILVAGQGSKLFTKDDDVTEIEEE